MTEEASLPRTAAAEPTPVELMIQALPLGYVFAGAGSNSGDAITAPQASFLFVTPSGRLHQIYRVGLPADLIPLLEPAIAFECRVETASRAVARLHNYGDETRWKDYAETVQNVVAAMDALV